MRNPIELLKYAMEVVRGNAKTLLLLSFVGAIISEVPVAVLERTFNPALWSGVYMLFASAVMLVSIVVTILVSIAMMHAIDKPKNGFKKTISQSLRYFWRYIGVSVLMTLIIFGGLLLLVIPGIIFMVMFMFATYVVIVEGLGVVSALKRSKELVRGYWWKVFGRVFVLGFLFVLISTIFQSVSGGFNLGTEITPIPTHIVNILWGVIAPPILLAYVYGMYQDLKKMHEA